MRLEATATGAEEESASDVVLEGVVTRSVQAVMVPPKFQITLTLLSKLKLVAAGY